MTKEDLQAELLQWIQDERHKAEASLADANNDRDAGYYDGMIDAYLSCFAKVVEMIDKAKEMDNG